MKYFTFLRVLNISVFAAILLSFVAFFCLRYLNESSTYNHRQELAGHIARDFEGKNYSEAMEDFNLKHAGPGGLRSQLWIVDEQGEILVSNTHMPLPIAWSEFSKPEAEHEVTLKYQGFNLNPEFTVIRLAAEKPTFLINQNVARRSAGRIIFEQFILIFVFITISIFLALSFTFIYLQRKSTEAKDILNRLEKGDLKARFKIKRIDQVGHLMLDFNRMASEIEHLVERVQESERSRRKLLQELGHDLRTPLTSISTSVETLQTHFSKMTETDRGELFGLIQGELHYFFQLLEDLFFIADLDEPRYKTNTIKINLAALLNSEVKSRTAISQKKINWEIQTDKDEATIIGNDLLILRLIKNIFDNASRFAQSKIQIRLFPSKISPGFYELQIDDDGVGISKDEISAFGQPRKQRSIETGDKLHVSLGLGSVIVKTIVELHEGRVDLTNLKDIDPSLHGTRVSIFLKKM